MTRCNVSQCPFAVLRLVVEKDVRTERSQKLRLVGAAQEQTFVQPDVPRPQRTDDSLMRRRCPRRHQCRTNRTNTTFEFGLQTMQTAEEILERASGQRSIRCGAFRRGKRIETVAPK